MMKTAGILGGLGPQSTALFYDEIIRLAQVRDVVEYPKMIINSMSIWDFSQAMYDKGHLFKLISAEIARIEPAVDFMAMVCNTVHCIIEPLRHMTKIPILAIQEEVVKKIRHDGLRTVGVLGTEITVSSDMYKEEFDKYGIEVHYLQGDKLEAFNQVIFQEMLRGQSYDKMHQLLKEYIELLIERGCEGIVLGCTELPLFIAQDDVAVPLYPSTQILAESVLEKCLGVSEEK